MKRHRLLAALLLAIAMVALAGCNEGNFKVTLRNDSPNTVRLKACNDSDCKAFNVDVKVQPGESIRATAATSNGITRWWLVVADDGARLGCLPLQYEGVHEAVVVNVSSAEAC